MDLNSLAGQSDKVLKAVDAIKNNPNLFEEFKAKPQETLTNLGFELNEKEVAMIQKFVMLSEIKDEAFGFFSKIKDLFGFKNKS